MSTHFPILTSGYLNLGKKSPLPQQNAAGVTAQVKNYFKRVL